jgi:parvulin-like peptidyl-prolyl isomerase
VAVLLAGGLCVEAEVVDGIVATVGTEVILQSEVMQEIAPFVDNLRQTSSSAEDFNRQVETQFRAALDQAIENKILLREALPAGLEVKDDQVVERLAEIRKRFKSNEDFQKELEKAGETMSEFREHVRKQILAISMGMKKHRQFEKEAEVSEADIEQYYKENTSKFTHPERVRLRRIFLSARQDALERAQVKARIEEIKKQLETGADFADLAKTYSAGPEAAQGGMVGWVNRNDLVQHLEDAAFSLPEGGLSDVLETEFGVVLLKVEKKEAAGAASLDEARTQIEPELRGKIADDRYKKWMSELRKRSRVRLFLS